MRAKCVGLCSWVGAGGSNYAASCSCNWDISVGKKPVNGEMIQGVCLCHYLWAGFDK